MTAPTIAAATGVDTTPGRPVQATDTRPTDESCAHWIGEDLRYCRATEGVRRYIHGHRCVPHDPRTLAGLPPLPESPGIPAYRKAAQA